MPTRRVPVAAESYATSVFLLCGKLPGRANSGSSSSNFAASQLLKLCIGSARAAATIMQATYHPTRVALSIAVAILVSYPALSLAARIAQSNARQVRFWLIGGAVAMGVGICSMHFIGMTASSLPNALRYNIATTLGSLGIAILTSGCALWIAGAARLGLRRLGCGALLMGTGICAMHYSGMSAIQIMTMIVYDLTLVAASVSIAVVACFTAL